MKVLYITQMYPSKELPQYCIFLHQQVKAMIANGINIQVVVPTTVKATGQEQFDGVDILYLNYRDFSRTLFYPLVTRRLKSQLKKFLNVNDYEIIYAIHGPANILDFARKIARSSKKPLVVHYRGYNIFDEYEKQKKALFSNVQRVQERVVEDSVLSIGVSDKTGAIITERFPQAPVVTVYNGVDSKLFAEYTEYEDCKVIKILCVANLIPIKGHKFLFDAFKMLQDKYPKQSLRLDIVGRGFFEEELKNYVDKNDIANIRFHGYVHYDKVADFMRATDIFVLPSIYESFGNVCMEAMASKKPIVIFEGQGVDELVEDGISAMIAPKGNVEELFLRIERLVMDCELRRKIAANGYEIAQQYSWDYSAKMIIKNIEGLTNDGN